MTNINSPDSIVKTMSYDQRLAAYERQKKTARLVCKTAEEYEDMVKRLAVIWEI